MRDQLEQISLDLCKAISLTSLLRPDGLAENLSNVENALALLEEYLTGIKADVDRAVLKAPIEIRTAKAA